MRENLTAWIAGGGIAAYLVLHFGFHKTGATEWLPLFVVLAAGGIPLLIELGRRVAQGEFGSDLLAGISIVAATVFGQYLVGAIIVLMLAGGEALERRAQRRASEVLDALAKRMPQVAHRVEGETVGEIPLAEVRIGDLLLVPPHETCPVDGKVVAGHGVMDESYLTGEPFMIAKAPGAAVLSGAINGEAALTIRAEKLARDSRYAKIMQVMEQTQQRRPRLRRLGDQIGAWYTPLAVGLAGLAWVLTGSSERFLAVIVIATPCPLILAIPVAVVGAISLAAKRSILVKDPAALELASTCRIAILDKTGTLTYGRPALTQLELAPGFTRAQALAAAASLERFSKHPLAAAILEAAHAEGIGLVAVAEISEPPGQGLRGQVGGHAVVLTGRDKLDPVLAAQLPAVAPGLECVLLQDGALAATMRFRDQPRPESEAFVRHLGPRHGFERILLVSGDRETEVRYLAEQSGISEVYAEQSPEQKLAIVQQMRRQAPTLMVGDGINDAPALLAATVGVAFGTGSDIAAEAGDAVILTPELIRLDEFIHISRRMRRIAIQSAGFGMAASLAGMGLAAMGWLPPLAGAMAQEVIDLLAVLNALRAALPGRMLQDVGTGLSGASAAEKPMQAGAGIAAHPG